MALLVAVRKTAGVTRGSSAAIDWSESRGRRSVFARLAWCAPGVIMVVAAGVVLVGWLAGSETVKSVSPGSSQMKPNTAIAFGCAGGSLLLLQARSGRRLAQALSVLVALIGAATLTEYLFGWQLGIDQLLFRDSSGGPGSPSPGRMGLNTAFNFVVAGLSLLWIDRRWRRVRPTQVGAAIIAVVALVAFLGYTFGVPGLAAPYLTRTITPMALHTSIVFLVLAGGLVGARPDAGIVALLRSPGAGGVLMRRLLLPAVVVPALVGYGRLEAQRAGLFGTEEGVVLFAISLIIVFSGLVIVTARSLERVDAERRASEARERGIVESSRDAILAAGPDRRIVVWNAAAERIYGYTAKEMIGQTALSVFPADMLAEIRQLQERLLAGESVEREAIQVRKDGEQIPVLLSAFPLRERTGQIVGTAAIVRDMTERRQLEDQLRQAQKMEAVGQLAGGVAHDFNNLLTVIIGYVNLILSHTEEQEPQRSQLGEIKRAAERATELTSQLLTFSRRAPRQTKLLDLNELVRGVEKMLRRLIDEDIALRINTAPALPAVQGDRGQLEQVLVNLVVNARDAMPAGGEIRIETYSVQLAPAEAARRGLATGRHLVLAVSDTGSGMTAETKTRIFEPFFTTKEQGKGTDTRGRLGQ